ncbi:MAG: hypothetical protein LUF68_09545 [Clostridiales bacterium]|nr:hypothetical protein [Clostridiales bacterium]
MFNESCLKEALVKYKRDFVSMQWKNERYKWEAIQTFRDNWDVNAPDFEDMLSRSLSKTSDLLAALNFYPRDMITKFAKAAPEEIRAMFLALMDESVDVIERIMAFKNSSSALLKNTEIIISSIFKLRMPSAFICGSSILISIIFTNIVRLKP